MADKAKDTVAIIDVGSNGLRFCIASHVKDKLKVIEKIEYPLNLARDTFNKGNVSYETLSKVCRILQGFLAVCKDYGVSSIKAVATTAVREASNMPYILDQIKVKTGLDVKVLDDNNEKHYIFKMIYHLISDDLKKSALVSYSGSGAVGVAALEEGKMTFMQSIKAGSLRIYELFENVREYSPEFYVVLEEYIGAFTDGLKENLPQKAVNFIASGAEIIMIARLLDSKKEGPFYFVERDKFLKLYDEIKHKTIERISAEYGVPLEKAEILPVEMCMYKSLLGFTSAKVITAPEISLAEALVFENLLPEEFSRLTKEFNKFTLTNARRMADKYGVAQSHYSLVEEFSTQIFDKMKKIHGLGRSDKLLLQTAAILHDCGKFVSSEDHNRQSYNLIKGSTIVGLTGDEIDIVANISLYHSRVLPSALDANYRELKSSKKVLVSKLAAILRIADALDRGRLQKFKEINVKMEGGELIVTASSNKNCELEQWAFKDKGVFFQEVFGIRPLLRIRRVM